MTLLLKYVKNPYLIRHALIVEGVMLELAIKTGYTETSNEWACVGLLHDIDYEVCPEEHCVKALEIFKLEGVPDSIASSAVSHGYGLTNITIEPTHPMEKVLFTIDELTGLLYACTLLRPSKSSKDLEVKSALKKFHPPSFASKCSRETILNGIQRLGWDLENTLQITIDAMRKHEDDIESFITSYSKNTGS